MDVAAVDRPGQLLDLLQVHVRGDSTRPWTVIVHSSRSTRGVSSAVRTGQSAPTSYCPGGRRPGSVTRRRPAKPRETRTDRIYSGSTAGGRPRSTWRTPAASSRPPIGATTAPAISSPSAEPAQERRPHRQRRGHVHPGGGVRVHDHQSLAAVADRHVDGLLAGPGRADRPPRTGRPVPPAPGSRRWARSVARSGDSRTSTSSAYAGAGQVAVDVRGRRDADEHRPALVGPDPHPHGRVDPAAAEPGRLGDQRVPVGGQGGLGAAEGGVPAGEHEQHDAGRGEREAEQRADGAERHQQHSSGHPARSARSRRDGRRRTPACRCAPTLARPDPAG